MSKFDDLFNAPVYFSNECTVISGKMSKEDAAEILGDYLGENITADDLEPDRVRFGFPPDNVLEREDLGACWYSGAGSGKGTQPVWVYGR